MQPLVVKDDVTQYDHVILFTPTTKPHSPDIIPQVLVDLLTKTPT